MTEEGGSYKDAGPSLRQKLFAPFGRVSKPLQRVWKSIGSRISASARRPQHAASPKGSSSPATSSEEEEEDNELEPRTQKLGLTPLMQRLQELEIKSTPRRSSRIEQQK